MTGEHERLIEGAAAIGVQLAEAQAALMVRYCELVDAANARFNLTAIARAESVPLHLLDSLTAAPHLPQDAERILDLGTGAGFPGVPLAIAFPERRFTLVDSTGKKTDFITAGLASLGVTNCTVVCGRAEVLARAPEHRAQYDAAAARAVAPLDMLAEMMLPLLKIGGLGIALKGSRAAEEAQAAGAAVSGMGAVIEAIHTVAVPGIPAPRAVVTVRKHSETPGRFPRARLRSVIPPALQGTKSR